MPSKVVSPDLVALSLSDLRRRGIHPSFAGYLCVKHCATYSGRNSGLQPQFREFFESFFRVSGVPETKPYVRFTEASDANLWLNKNLAGSYAQSSIRHDSPFRQVVKIGTGRKATYMLNRDHAARALKLLANSSRIPVLPLAVFLYRDYALLTGRPALEEWVEVFREEFGYPHDPEGEAEFDTLYSITDTITQGKDWLVDVT